MINEYYSILLQWPYCYRNYHCYLIPLHTHSCYGCLIATITTTTATMTTTTSTTTTTTTTNTTYCNHYETHKVHMTALYRRGITATLVSSPHCL